MQESEKILIEGVEFNLSSEPFNVFLSLKNTKLAPISSGNVRGYLGRWGIQENQLLLLGLSCFTNDVDLISLKHHLDSSPIQFRWFSGPLYVPKGSLIRDGYFGVHSEYIVLFVELGVVKSRFEVAINFDALDEKRLNTRIDEMDFLSRTTEVLAANGIIYLGDLLLKSESYFYGMRNLGRKSVNEIAAVYRENNMELVNSNEDLIACSENNTLALEWSRKIFWDDVRRIV